MGHDRLTTIPLSLNLRVVLALLVLAVIFFSSFFIQGRVFLAADTLYQYYPWKYYAPQNFRPYNSLITDPVNSSYPAMYNKQLKERNISLWNPYALTGMPRVAGTANSAIGPYFPLRMILHIFFSTPVALTLFLFIHVLFMGLFMYYYLNEIGAGWRGALFGAVAYMFNGCAMVWLEFETWVTVFAYFPLLFVFMERFVKLRKYRYAFAGGIAYGIMLLNAAFQLAVYVSIFMAFYLIFLIMRSYYKSEDTREVGPLLICFTITGFVGLLIGAVEILPFIEIAANSSRNTRVIDFSHFFTTLARVPYRFFVTLFFPDFFGSPISHLSLIPRLPSQTYMNYNELTLYMGVPTVFAFTACLIAHKNTFSRFYLFMTLLVVAMITGSYVYYPFFKLVPGMDKMNPTRLIFLLAFVFSAASGLGVKGLFEMEPKRRNIFLGSSALIVAGICFIAFYGNGPEISRWFNQEQFEFLPPAQASRMMKLIHDMRGPSSPIIYKPLILTVVAFCLFSVLAIIRNNIKFNIVFLLILSVLGLDLISFGKNYNTTAAPELVYSKKPSIEFLLKQNGPFRVIQDTDNGLYVNTLIPFGLEEIGGYTSVYPDRINKLMSYIRYGDQVSNGKIFDRWVIFGSRSTDLSSRFFDLMNVRYVLTAPNVKMPNKKFKLVFREDMAIYENRQVMPRAYVVHDYTVMPDLSQQLKYIGSDAFNMRKRVVLEKEPSSEWTSVFHAPSYPPKTSIDMYNADEIRICADLSTNGLLILSDAYYPGWIAEVDGKEVEIHRANGNFRAVELSRGKHRVSFIYKPLSFRIGLCITFIGIVLAAFGVGLCLWDEYRGIICPEKRPT